jgi:pimeloyl-ACP methyl ester carboxylesterase
MAPGQGAAQQQVEIPEISIPKMEHMIDVGGRKLHACVYGSGLPVLVLVSAFETDQKNWNPVVPDLAAKATVVTYDRAGVGKSELGDLPAHGEQSAKDLHVLLEKLAVPGPYILVGHSFGGFVARLFASMYPDDMAGLILEETQHEDNFSEMKKILKGKDLEMFEQVLVPGFAAPENPKSERDYRDATREQLKTSQALPRMPFVVLTVRDRAYAMRPIFSEGALAELARLDEELMNRLAASLPGGKHVMIEGTGHYVHVDKPALLIAPVLEMIQALREKKHE